MTDDLSIPAFLRTTSAGTPCREHHLPEEHEHAYGPSAWEEKQRWVEPASFKKQNGFDAFKRGQQTKTAVILGSRYDATRGRWVAPEDDFVRMATQAKVSLEELRAAFSAPGATFGKRFLAQVDQGRLALEGEKMMERTRRRLKRKAMANACAARAPRKRV